MNRSDKKSHSGFTLVELLVVIAIIGLLASLTVPIAGRAASGSKKRKAQMEANSLKVSVQQYYQDHHFMPWTEKSKVGADKWVPTDESAWMEILQGENVLKKNYFAAKTDDEGKFLDPWGHPYYVGMDRDQDGYVKGKVEGGVDVVVGGKIVRETVGVFCLGPDGQPGTADYITTFDWVSE